MTTVGSSAPAAPEVKQANILPLLAVVFIMVGSVSTLWPILTPYASDLGAGGLGLGLVVGAIYATRLVLGPWIGRLADRYGYRALLLTGTLLYVPIAIVYASASSVAVLVIARLLHGVGSAIVLPMVMAVLGQHSAGRSGAVMARYNAAQWFGYAIGPLVGGLMVAWLSAEAVFLLLAPAGVVSAVAVLLVDRRLMTVPDEQAETDDGRTAPNRLDRPARALLAFNFIVAPASLIILSFFPLLGEDRGYSPVLIGFLLAVASFVTAASQPFWGRIADSSGIRPLLVTGGIGTLVGLALLGGVDLLPVAILATLTAGIAIAGLVAGTSTAAVEAGRNRRMGSYIGLFHSAGSTGQAIMPLVYGLLLGAIGVGGLLIAVGVVVGIVSLTYVVALLRKPVVTRVGASHSSR